jgi:serine phosphatase RsbU (regulator of sigma subunit)
MDASGKHYQTHRIRGHVKDGGSGVQALGQAIIGDVQQFIGDRSQTDDICLVCLGRRSLPCRLNELSPPS